MILSLRKLVSRDYSLLNNVLRTAKSEEEKIRPCYDYIRSATLHLTHSDIPNARLEAERLFAISMGFRDWNEWYVKGQECVHDDRIPLFREWIIRRGLREPFHYITGLKEFYGRDFEVSRFCLIPRPETELVIDVVKEIFSHKSNLTILELGTGSGCIGITLAKELENCRQVTMTDCSKEALAVATNNAHRWDLLDKLNMLKGFWFDFEKPLNSGIIDNSPGCFLYDCIVSNPPYLSRLDMLDSVKSELVYEPCQALYGGEDGLDAYRSLAQGSRKYLRPDGRIIVEIGARQHELVRTIFSRFGFDLERSYRDLNSIIRVLVFRSAYMES